jgi:hypothetical protein
MFMVVSTQSPSMVNCTNVIRNFSKSGVGQIFDLLELSDTANYKLTGAGATDSNNREANFRMLLRWNIDTSNTLPFYPLYSCN